MVATALFDEDLLDLIFDNINPDESPNITASRLEIDGSQQHIEILGINSHGGTLLPDQVPTIENVSMIQMSVATSSVINCRPGDVITISEGGRSKNYSITSMSVEEDQTKMELVPSNTPLPDPPIIDVVEDYLEVEEEAALDIDMELGRLPDEK